MTMSFRLEATPANETEQQIIDDLSGKRESLSPMHEDAPGIKLTFTPRGEAIDMTHYTIQVGKKITDGTLRVEKEERQDAAKLLAYRFLESRKPKLEINRQRRCESLVKKVDEKPV